MKKLVEAPKKVSNHDELVIPQLTVEEIFKNPGKYRVKLKEPR